MGVGVVCGDGGLQCVRFGLIGEPFCLFQRGQFVMYQQPVLLGVVLIEQEDCFVVWVDASSRVRCLDFY